MLLLQLKNTLKVKWLIYILMAEPIINFNNLDTIICLIFSMTV